MYLCLVYVLNQNITNFPEGHTTLKMTSDAPLCFVVLMSYQLSALAH